MNLFYLKTGATLGSRYMANFAVMTLPKRKARETKTHLEHETNADFVDFTVFGASCATYVRLWSCLDLQKPLRAAPSVKFMSS